MTLSGYATYRTIDRATLQSSSNRRYSSTSWAIGVLRKGLTDDAN